LVLLAESKPAYPHRIQMQISSHLVEPGLVEDQHRFEPALENVTPATMCPVEPTGIAGLEPADCVAEVGLPAAQQQMVVIGHQDKRMYLEGEALG
jgi:hypothetical protein